MPISVGAGLAIAGGVSAAAGVAGSLLSSSTAANAAKNAAAVQQAMYEQTRGDLSPFVTTGYNALKGANALAMGSPTGGGPDYISMAQQNLPGNMTQAQLEQTPGYQFTLAQGLKATQSAAAARGLGVSGAALKGAATYATGLADSTYANRFNESQQRFTDFVNLNQGQQGNLTNQFNRLSGIATLGENAAAQTGTLGQKEAAAEGAFLSNAGMIQGQGIMNATNSITGSLNNALGAYYANKYGPGGSPMTGGYSGPTNAANASADPRGLFAPNSPGY